MTTIHTRQLKTIDNYQQTHTHSEYVIIIVFLLQLWLCERAQVYTILCVYTILRVLFRLLSFFDFVYPFLNLSL